ncbi:MAG: Asparagine synthetase [Cyanobacteria bacterium RYN_339]|nr:Asparagine synthetase [Cyanobacteria bacterium RYN_339]
MSGICGWVGEADPATLTAMLDAIDYRGDRTDTAFAPGVALGYRWWGDRPGKAPGILRDGPRLAVMAGTLAPAVADPAAAFLAGLPADVDGAFAGAQWDGEYLTLVRDPFGVRSLYYATHQGVFYFASELKQLLAIPGFPVEPDLVAIHKYLTYSFVPGEAVPIQGVRRLLPGHVATWRDGRLATRRYFQLREDIDPAFEADPKAAVKAVRKAGRQAVARRLNGETEVGVFLSGGLDSSAVALWLKEAGVGVRALGLDFGAASVEREEAIQVAKALEIPFELVKVGGEDLAPILFDLVWKLDLPFGDAVTGPQYLLGRAAHAAGLSAVFNGEGGDQLFGGWTAKPMLAAALFPTYGEAESPEEQYLQSYHRFYGLEDQLYTPAFQAQVGGPGQRRAHLAPYLGEASMGFLNRIRLADIALKGSQNILPRAERMANAWALDVRVPLFDRRLAVTSFRLPPQLKLHGVVEKWVLKKAVGKHLPEEIVWRKKSGMSVPITDWALGPLAPVMHDLLGPAALAKRGYFEPAYVARLLAGEGEAGDVRRRRVGERLWALAMLEAWFRVFVDGRGKRP